MKFLQLSYYDYIIILHNDLVALRNGYGITQCIQGWIEGRDEGFFLIFFLEVFKKAPHTIILKIIHSPYFFEFS